VLRLQSSIRPGVAAANFKRVLIAGALILAPATALADPIDQVDYFSMTASQSLTLGDASTPPPPGVNYDSILIQNGVAFGERFAGQTLSTFLNNDKLSDTTTGPLTLLAGAATTNLAVMKYGSSPVLVGLGGVGYPNFDSLGEGAVSFLFSTDQSQFGFAVFGANAGDATLDFWRADGSLIQSVTVNDIADTYYGFARSGGIKDIRGISIWNTDAAGIAYNRFKYDVASDVQLPPPTRDPNSGVPEPATWAMLLVGFAGAGALLRRRRAGRACAA